MKTGATWPERIMFAVLAMLMMTCIASAQQTVDPSSQSASSIDSEKRAGNNFDLSFASAEFGLGSSARVEGAPFSAIGTKETTQILSDGQRIVRRMTMSISRDSVGRTRIEWGNSKKTEGTTRIPMVYNAVTGLSYLLNPRDHRVVQLPFSINSSGARQAQVITPQSPPDNITQVVGEKIEPLGTEMIEGVKAEGVRVTTTIPASEMSNNQPGKVIYERWYSQELRRNILIKCTDPRFGEAVFKLTNIDRNEPPRELFLIPADYKVIPFNARQLKPAPGSQEDGRVSVKLERGDRIALDNRTTGRITIIGWDRDSIEATATSKRGVEAVSVNITDESAGKRIFLKADYADHEDKETRQRRLAEHRKSLQGRLQALDIRRESLKARLTAIESMANESEREPSRKELLSSLAELEAQRKEVADLLAGLDAQDEPLPSPAPEIEAAPRSVVKPVPPDNAIKPSPAFKLPESTITSPTLPAMTLSAPLSGGHPVEVNLEVKVPRSAEIEVIRVNRSEVEVTGIETPLVISGDKSRIKLSQVGAVEVKTSSGNVEIENAAGLVDVVTASGAISVRDARDVRALSISGLVEIQCARGQVDVSATDGAVKLLNVRGDVDVTTTSSDISYAGTIRLDGRYHLKSMSGAVEMILAADSPGFTVALSSYKGLVSTDFLLKMKESSQHGLTSGTADAAVNRRVIGSYGSGRAQIVLDTFDGNVKLGKLSPGEMKECKMKN